MSAGNKVMKNHGGKLWDALFLIIKDNDKDFIIDYIKRIPCEYCIKDTLNKIEKYYDFNNKSVEEIRRLLWSLRCRLISKYKDTDEDYNNFIDYLNINKI